MNDVLEQDSRFVDGYLEHFGKKGMHWGVRKSVFRGAQRGDWRTRSGGQKVGLVAGGAVGSVVGAEVVKKLLLRRVKTQQGLAAVGLVSLGAQFVGAKYGARLTRNLLQKHGKKPMKQIRKLHNQPLSDQESIRRVQQYINNEKYRTSR